MGNGAKVGLVGVLALIVLVVAVWDKSQDGAKKGAPGMAVSSGAAPDGAAPRAPAGDPSVRVLPRVPEQGDRVTGTLEPGLRIGPAPSPGSSSSSTSGPPRASPIAAGGAAPRPAPGPATAAPAAPTAPSVAAAPGARRTYKVQESDTLSSIALAHLGAKSRWPEIYEANRDRLASPDSLVVGHEIVIPDRPGQGAGPGAAPAAAPRPVAPGAAATPLAASFPPPPAGARTHAVARGETLSTISEKHYGVRTKWHKIFLANKERLPDPDRLQEGMVLVIPD